MRVLFGSAVAFVSLVATSSALAAGAPVRVGSVEAWEGGGEGPVAAGASRTETISLAGAAFVRVHFRGVRLADGDALVVSRPDGGDAARYTGRGPFGTGEFWSFSVDGETAVVRLETSGRGGSRYRITEVVRGEEPWGQIASICGDNGLENAVCRMPEVTAAQRPVARINFISNGGSFVCTGSLVRGSNANTFLTNNHCVASQAATQTVEARFNYQTTTCTGTTVAAFSRYAGSRFLRTSSGLDYTLFTLGGSPEATWGELIPTRRAVAVGQRIWLIQHPGGRTKKIGYFEDAAKTRRCDVETINRSVGGYNAGSQMGYSCDTEGGSSGSPVIAAGGTRVIGLHHLGGCRNSGTHMSHVCTHAGSLLTCATD